MRHHRKMRELVAKVIGANDKSSAGDKEEPLSSEEVSCDECERCSGYCPQCDA